MDSGCRRLASRFSLADAADDDCVEIVFAAGASRPADPSVPWQSLCLRSLFGPNLRSALAGVDLPSSISLADDDAAAVVG